MKTTRIGQIVVVSLLIMLFAEASYAFDGERRGFLLGFGLGIGQTSGVESEEKKTGINTDFKIGHGFSNTTQVYWTAKASFFRLSVPVGYLEPEKKKTYLSGVGTIGVSLFLNPKSPSPYFTGGLGYSSFGKLQPDAGETTNDLGIGFFAGFGYEFARHWSFEIDLIAGGPSYGESDHERSIWTIKATLNGLAY